MVAALSQLLSFTIFLVRCQALLDAWFPLWPFVFQPAIGVLMLGAVRGFHSTAHACTLPCGIMGF